MIRTLLLAMVLAIPMTAAGGAEPSPNKPRIAFFPLGGSAKEELREKSGDALRAKLDRTGAYEVIDGPKMLEIAAEAKEAIGFDTAADVVGELGKLVEAKVLVWGELSNTGEGTTLRLKMLDLREPDGKPREVTKVIKEQTELRFVFEEVLEMLKGVSKFEHPSEESVTNDPAAAELWKKNPNLVRNPDFSSAGLWEAIYQAEKYEVKVSDKLPEEDKVVIYRMPAEEKGGRPNNVLAMNLSRYCAENNGMKCRSAAFRFEPDTRYRLSFRYKSDGPRLRVFVKGYTLFDNIKGEKVEHEVCRSQVTPSGKTDGQWVTVVHDSNPQNEEYPVQTLRVDFHAYLNPGIVLIDDVVVKAVGKQTHQAKDEAIKKTVSRPKGAK